MKTELYFLRSTEQKIVSDMLPVARRLDSSGKSIEDFPELSIYDSFYGYTSKDLGLYALCDSQLAGAVWIRRLNSDHQSDAYVDDNIPVLNIAVLSEFRNRGIGSSMLKQLLQEAGVLYDSLCVRVVIGDVSERFFMQHGFNTLENTAGQSIIDGSSTVTMIKQLDNKGPVRPKDSYNPSRWMD